MDPLAKKYPELTSYQFSSNSPIFMVESEGLEGSIVVKEFEVGKNGLTKVDEWTLWANRANMYSFSQSGLMEDLNQNVSDIFSIGKTSVIWGVGKSKYLAGYHKPLGLYCRLIGALVGDTRKTYNEPQMFGKLELNVINLKNGGKITIANYYEDKKSEAIWNGIKDIFQGGTTIAAGTLTEGSSFGLTSEVSIPAIIYGTDQLISGFITLNKVASGTCENDGSFDNRPLRKGMLFLFGENGGKVYDLGNVAVNVKGVLTVNNASSEVIDIFNEISRFNSAISIKDGIITIKPTNSEKKEK